MTLEAFLVDAYADSEVGSAVEEITVEARRLEHSWWPDDAARLDVLDDVMRTLARPVADRPGFNPAWAA